MFLIIQAAVYSSSAAGWDHIDQMPPFLFLMDHSRHKKDQGCRISTDPSADEDISSTWLHDIVVGFEENHS